MTGDEKRHELAEATPLGRSFAKNLDDAWIGITRRVGAPALAVYDYELLVDALEEAGDTREDAEVTAAELADTYGINSPLVLYRFDTPEDEEEEEEEE